MKIFLLLLFIAGLALTVYGIWELRHIYADEHCAVGRVTGYKAYLSTNVWMTAAYAAAAMQYPIVAVTLDSGEVRKLRLHQPVAMSVIEKAYPELLPGGEVLVTYFGKNPKQAFLTGHPLSKGQKPMKSSPFLLAGLALMLTPVATILLWYWVVNYV